MDEQQKTEPLETPAEESAPPEEAAPGKRPRRDRSELNAFENFYENFRNVPLKYIDIFIGVCLAALIAVIIVGIVNR